MSDQHLINHWMDEKPSPQAHQLFNPQALYGRHLEANIEDIWLNDTQRPTLNLAQAITEYGVNGNNVNSSFPNTKNSFHDDSNIFPSSFTKNVDPIGFLDGRTIVNDDSRTLPSQDTLWNNKNTDATLYDVLNENEKVESSVVNNFNYHSYVPQTDYGVKPKKAIQQNWQSNGEGATSSSADRRFEIGTWKPGDAGEFSRRGRRIAGGAMSNKNHQSFQNGPSAFVPYGIAQNRNNFSCEKTNVSANQKSRKSIGGKSASKASRGFQALHNASQQVPPPPPVPISTEIDFDSSKYAISYASVAKKSPSLESSETSSQRASPMKQLRSRTCSVDTNTSRGSSGTPPPLTRDALKTDEAAALRNKTKLVETKFPFDPSVLKDKNAKNKLKEVDSVIVKEASENVCWAPKGTGKMGKNINEERSIKLNNKFYWINDFEDNSIDSDAKNDTLNNMKQCNDPGMAWRKSRTLHINNDLSFQDMSQKTNNKVKAEYDNLNMTLLRKIEEIQDEKEVEKSSGIVSLLIGLWMLIKLPSVRVLGAGSNALRRVSDFLIGVWIELYLLAIITGRRYWLNIKRFIQFLIDSWRKTKLFFQTNGAAMWWHKLRRGSSLSERNEEKSSCVTADQIMRRLYFLPNDRAWDAYSILDVSIDATNEEIRKQQKKLNDVLECSKKNCNAGKCAFGLVETASNCLLCAKKRGEINLMLHAKFIPSVDYVGEMEFLLSSLREFYESKDSYLLPCFTCGEAHKKRKIQRNPIESRFCKPCSCWHSVKEGDIWCESYFWGILTRYYAFADSSIYDITSWANCQKFDLTELKANTHLIHYRISSNEALINDTWLNNLKSCKKPKVLGSVAPRTVSMPNGRVRRRNKRLK